MSFKQIYLHEADEYVGPFRSLRDAESFMAMMALFGGNCEGIEVVELDSDRRNTIDLASSCRQLPCGKIAR